MSDQHVCHLCSIFEEGSLGRALCDNNFRSHHMKASVKALEVLIDIQKKIDKIYRYMALNFPEGFED